MSGGNPQPVSSRTHDVPAWPPIEPRQTFTPPPTSPPRAEEDISQSPPEERMSQSPSEERMSQSSSEERMSQSPSEERRSPSPLEEHMFQYAPDRRISARSIYREQAHRFHQDLVPQNDFEILALGSIPLNGYSTQEKVSWLEQEWEDTVAAYKSEEAALQSIKNLLNEMVEPTGVKPRPDDPDVNYARIDAHLSLRLWPGSLADAEYCMDFVMTQTKAPINKPEKYTVWVIPDPAMPWIAPACTEIMSIERLHGFQPDEILDGEEKFILRDGLWCQLVCDDEPVLRFRVPVRPGALVEDETVPTVDLE